MILQDLRAELRDLFRVVNAIRIMGGWKYRGNLPDSDEAVKQLAVLGPMNLRLLLFRAAAGLEVAKKYDAIGDFNALVAQMVNDTGALPARKDGYAHMPVSPEMMQRWEDMNVAVAERIAGPYARALVQNFRIITEIWAAHGNRDVSILHHKGPAVVCASGPSLLDAAPALKAFNGVIYTGAQDLGWFMREKIAPHYAVVIDEQPNIGGNILQARNALAGFTRVLTHPCIHPWVIDYWPRDKQYFYLARNPTVPADGMLEDVYGTIAGRPGICTSIRHAANFVNAGIALAVMAGCSPIYLVGYDLAYHSGWLRWDRKGAPPEDAKEVEGQPGVYTDDLMLAYEAMTMGILEKHPEWDVRTCSPKGLLRGMKQATLEEVANAG